MVSPLVVSLKKQKKFYGSKITIFSPAKINLYLNIIGEYQDPALGGKSFHQLESIVERLSLRDLITIKIKKKPAVEIFSNIKSLKNPKNLCVRAVNLLREKFRIPFGFDIILKKKIPIGSGLGGGSSNAASTLIGMNSLLNLGLDKSDLYKFGAFLGSDVNFFLSESKFAFLEGRGECITPLDIDTRFNHLIIWPGIQLSTRRVYEHARVKLTKFFNNVKIIRYALKKADIFLLQKNTFNALERAAFSACYALEKVKKRLEKEGVFSQLTGSGSAFYTIGEMPSVSKLRRILPKQWLIFKVQTF
jgi:4-diphosphocytidyl-2-C-methyl-D-erythritol kinase